jgi:uncharacterized protein (DUF362 family)
LTATLAVGCGPSESGRTRDASKVAGGKATVALLQSSRSAAEQISVDEVTALVEQAIVTAGGFGFLRDGQSVVLKPNLVNTITTSNQPLSPTVNGVTTDFRVTRAVARLVRKRNPSGKILVMEGSTENTREAFERLSYTRENFGDAVDEFIALEGDSCANRSTEGLVERIGRTGRKHWIDQRFVNADVVISIAVLKTHSHAGVTGAVKNLAIGMTPASQYSTGKCARGQSAQYIDHSRSGLPKFIVDYYALRKADFAIIDGLQGMQNGPNPLWVGGGNYTADKMNMRLIMASRDPVAVDTIEALVMGCDPKSLEYLSALEADGFGVADPNAITVVGKTIADVKREFKGPEWACGAQ